MKYDPEFTLVAILQAIYLADVIILFSAIETAGAFLILFSAAYFKIIQKRLEGFKNSLGTNLQVADSLDYNEIRECVIFHQKVLE